MIYLYSKEFCSACEKRKVELMEGAGQFIMRDADRLDNDPRIFDEADKEAFLKLQMQNLTFPVEVDIVDE